MPDDAQCRHRTREHRPGRGHRAGIDTTPDDSPGDSLATDYRRLRRDLLAVESAELENLYQNGTITDATRRGIQRILDLEDAGLSDEEP